MSKCDVDVIVECRGGETVAIYSDNAAIRVVLVDWDEYHDEGRPGILYPVDRISEMPTDTRGLIEGALKSR
jgi:hypothetical protein